jgi:hypothetical protein
MEQQFHYATVTEAIEKLKEQGYTLDLNLNGDKLESDGQSFPVADFEITDLYRYEGQSDPADEAVVYALISAEGLKGVLVTGYGNSMDEQSVEALRELHYKYEQGSKE